MGMLKATFNETPEIKDHFARFSWEYTTKLYVREIGYEDVD
jgi:hypothetical protein